MIIESSYNNKIKNAFKRHYSENSDVWTTDIGMRILPLLIQGKLRLSSDSKILDIGCGSGDDAIIYCTICEEVTGIDIHEHTQWVNLHANYSNIHFYNDNFLNYKKDVKYDVIVDNGCFHHQEETQWLSWLNKVYTLLKSNGYFVLSTFCDDNQNSYIDGYQRQHHYFSDLKLESLLKNASFSIIDTIYIYRPKYKNYYRIQFCQKITDK